LLEFIVSVVEKPGQKMLVRKATEIKKAVCEVARRGFIWQVSRRVTVREIQKNDVRLQIKKFLGGFRNLSSSGRRRPESIIRRGFETA
jgi:hypothetical protein